MDGTIARSIILATIITGRAITAGTMAAVMDTVTGIAASLTNEVPSPSC